MHVSALRVPAGIFGLSLFDTNNGTRGRKVLGACIHYDVRLFFLHFIPERLAPNPH